LNPLESPTPAATPRTRAKARHILDNYFIGPARDPEVLEIWGYTNQISYLPGDEVVLHVSTTAAHWSLEVGRDGQDYVPLLKENNIPGDHQDTPQECSITGCDWSPSYRFDIPQDWESGGYLITFRAEKDGDQIEEHHLFILRRSVNETPAPFVLICATGTWLAYNCWGGSNFYEGIAGENADAPATQVSTQRPWTRGFCKLPQGAPRPVAEVAGDPGSMVRYPYMEWAYAYGYSKKFASAGWASYERHFARWAEMQGIDLDFATLHDLEATPELLDRYRCAIFVGHDEYWSANMRHSVDRFADSGGKLARFAGNFLWQTRIEDEGRTQVCFKDAFKNDPVFGTDRERLTTTAWEASPVNWPGAKTFGANALQGIYAGLGGCVRFGSGGFTVYRPKHWALEGTFLSFGDQLGSRSQVFGYEVDGVDYQMKKGLPYATGIDGTDPNINILAMGLATKLESGLSVWGQTEYIGTADAVAFAEALAGEATEEALDELTTGNGVMLHWHKGKGQVFNAATCEWVMGLARRDHQIERITLNVLNRFGR